MKNDISRQPKIVLTDKHLESGKEKDGYQQTTNAVSSKSLTTGMERTFI
ncbi:MAG: hypothetical protein KHW87_06335 [Clostridiales bacterium]|nr:hypothetical protein [Clostridiales bacterium]